MLGFLLYVGCFFLNSLFLLYPHGRPLVLVPLKVPETGETRGVKYSPKNIFFGLQTFKQCDRESKLLTCGPGGPLGPTTWVGERSIGKLS